MAHKKGDSIMAPIDLRPRISEWQRRLLLCVSGLLAFETLTRAPGLYTIGGESHQLIE